MNRLGVKVFRDTLADAWDGIRFQPGRAGLSAAAVGVGMVSLTLLLCVLGGLRERSRHLLEELGAQVFAILPGYDDSGNARGELTLTDVAVLTAGMPDCRVSTVRRFESKSAGGAETMSVIAADENLLRVRGWRLIRGRFLDARDTRRMERHTVITQSLSRQGGLDLGSVALLKGIPFTVVGIVSSGSGSPAELADVRPALSMGASAAVVPLTASRLWRDRETPDERTVDAIFVQARGTGALERSVRTAMRLLHDPRRGAGACTWITPDVMLQGVRRLQALIALTVGSVSLLCLALGGTTLMSLMIANVRDRVAEIGLRRALGAGPWDIARLFVMESCLLTGTASLAAVAGSHVLLVLLRHLLPIPVAFGPATLSVPVILALALGALFSWAPAALAARISPSEALRTE